MAKHLPGYLKLHVEDSDARREAMGEDLRDIDKICLAFSQLTGWQLQLCDEKPAGEPDWTMPVSLADDRLQLVLQRPTQAIPGASTDTDHVRALAKSVGDVIVSLQTTRQTVWQREAELAAGIPVNLRDEGEHLAERLEAVLQGGAEAVNCQAAALYLLDDATSQLKLRSCWGLPRNRLLDPPRPLRGAVADLEALVGHAVVLEDTSLLPHWKVPESFPSAVCVPVATSSTPLGTLWMFSDRVRDYTAEETNLIEIIAGRLVADLERELLRHEGAQSQRLNRYLQDAAQWQQDRLPRFQPQVDGWELAGWTAPAGWIGGDFYDWSLPADDRLAVALGDAFGGMITSALNAASLHAALKSEQLHANHCRDALGEVNQVLWSASAGDQFASLFLGWIDPATGDLQYAWAGHVGAVLIQKSGHRNLCRETAPLGAEPDAEFESGSLRLQPGDTLLVFSEGIRKSQDASGQAVSPELLAKLVGDVQHANASQILDLVRAAIPYCHTNPAPHDRTLLVVKRKGQ